MGKRKQEVPTSPPVASSSPYQKDLLSQKSSAKHSKSPKLLSRDWSASKARTRQEREKASLLNKIRNCSVKNLSCPVEATKILYSYSTTERRKSQSTWLLSSTNWRTASRSLNASTLRHRRWKFPSKYKKSRCSSRKTLRKKQSLWFLALMSRWRRQRRKQSRWR